MEFLIFGGLVLLLFIGILLPLLILDYVHKKIEKFKNKSSKNKKIMENIQSAFLIIFCTAPLVILLIIGIIVRSSVKLEKLDYTVGINEDGSVNITELWEANINRTNTLFITFDNYNKNYTEITNVKVRELSGDNIIEFKQSDDWQYHVDKNKYHATFNEDGEFEIAWGVGLDDSRAKKTYEIEYTVVDEILRANDYAEFFWSFIDEDNTTKAKLVTGTIYLPDNANSINDIQAWGHSLHLNESIKVVDNNTIKFKYKNPLTDNEILEVRVLFPNDLVNKDLKRNIDEDIFEETEQEEELMAKQIFEMKISALIYKNKWILMTFIICIIDAMHTFVRIRRKKKIYRKYKPTQKLDYYRDLPRDNFSPIEMFSYYKIIKKKNLFVTDKDMGKLITAILLQLKIDKSIDIELDSNNDIIIFLNNFVSDEKLECKIVYDLLKKVSEKNSITEKELRKYFAKNSSSKSLKRELEKTLNQLNDGNNVLETVTLSKKIYFLLFVTENIARILTVIGAIISINLLARFILPTNIILEALRILKYIIATIIFAIISIILAPIYGFNYIDTYCMTQKSVNEAEMIKGLERYIIHYSLLKEKEIPAIEIWKRYLIFSTIFGISKKLLKQIKINFSKEREYNYLEEIDFANKINEIYKVGIEYNYSSYSSSSNGYSSSYSFDSRSSSSSSSSSHSSGGGTSRGGR